MKDSRLTRAGVSGYNQPKRTPNHPTKSHIVCLLYTSPSPRDRQKSRMPSSA